MGLDWKRVAIDAITVFIASVVAGFVVGIIAGSVGVQAESAALALVALNSLAIIGAFAYCSARIKEKPWKHLVVVALVVWVISLIQPLLGFVSYSQWVASIVIIFILMLIGGGIGRLFVRA
jgi:hypothetical protein